MPEADIGFVPTMGYLHTGHLSLADRARAENKLTVVSLFVNPTQFGPKEDFTKYPRDEERDLALLERARVDLVFIPTAEDIYGSRKDQALVHLPGITEVLEGSIRPGHFDGVCTIVAKLFNLVRPRRAYFGQKDAQQLAVIKKMVRDLNFAVEIVPCPTIRDSDGLALSSRNVYLDATARTTALGISRGLFAAEKLWQAGVAASEALCGEVRSAMAQGNFSHIDYVEVVDGETFDRLPEAKPGAIIVVAAKVGTTRLIDNICLK